MNKNPNTINSNPSPDNSKAWEEFLPPAIPELPDNNYYPPTLPELPDHESHSTAAPATPDEKIIDHQDQGQDYHQDTANTASILDKQDPALYDKQSQLARTAVNEIRQQANQERQAIEDAHSSGKISDTEYTARKQALEYYTLDRLNKVREDYTELRNDPFLKEAANKLAEFNANAMPQPNDNQDSTIEPNQPDQAPKSYTPEQLREMVINDVQNHIDAKEKAARAKYEADAKAQYEAEQRKKYDAEQKAEREAEIARMEAGNAALREEVEALRAKDAELKAQIEQNKAGKDAEALKQLEADLKDAEKEVAKWRESLTELYAKNRGLFVSGKNRAAFTENQHHYQESLSRLLHLQAQITEKTQRAKNAESLQPLYDKLTSELAAGNISVEEANEKLGGKWGEMEKKLKETISVEFVDQFIKEQKALEDKTIDRIDNGGLYRKIVSKVINNKPLKVVLATAGLAGLAATGFGLATGALALGVSYTAGGVAFGAGKGALSGLVMSRQDSKNSAARGFAGSREEIEKQLRDIDAAGNEADVKNVTNWLLKRYGEANQSDHSGNVKRTAIAMGLGAVIGGATSGIQINQIKTEYKDHAELVGQKPTEYQAANLDSVNHAKGTGTQQFFRELGGDGDAYYSSGAHEQMASVLEKYGITVGENDWTYPGPISEWPTNARQAFTEVADEWAKKGLVAATKIGGEPIYDIKTEAINTIISDKMHNFFVQAASVVGAGILGGAIAGRRNRIKHPEEMPTIHPNDNIAPLPFEAFEIAQPTPPPVAEPQSQNPNQGAGAPEAGPADTIRNQFQDLVGEEGVNLMTSAATLDTVLIDRIDKWWQSLTPESQQAVIAYEKEHDDMANDMGRALRGWLRGYGNI